MDDAYIKKLRGDAPGSNVMETTYRHLSDDDAVEHATAKYRGEEPEQRDSPMTPDSCPTCNEILSRGAKSCERCGTVFTPDAKAAKDVLEEDQWECLGEADSDELREVLHAQRELLQNHPELLDQLPNEMVAELL